MTDPARAERLWLALAVATLWVISTGDALEQDLDVPVIRDLSPAAARAPRLVGPASFGSASAPSWPPPWPTAGSPCHATSRPIPCARPPLCRP